MLLAAVRNARLKDLEPLQPTKPQNKSTRKMEHVHEPAQRLSGTPLQRATRRQQTVASFNFYTLSDGNKIADLYAS